MIQVNGRLVWTWRSDSGENIKVPLAECVPAEVTVPDPLTFARDMRRLITATPAKKPKRGRRVAPANLPR